MADVRVGIVSWNTAALLDRCLTALPAALGGLDAEVVVVDNASADGSADVAAGHAGVTVVRNDTNRGYAAAMNQALAASDAPTLVALNPDTEPGPGSLAALVEHLGRHPRAGLVVPRLVDPADGRPEPSVQRFPSIRLALAAGVPRRLRTDRFARRWCLDTAGTEVSGSIDWAFGAVHVIRAAALDDGPPYSERWFMYVEDLELGWRLHGSGWEVLLDADVEIAHVGNAAGAQAWGSSRAARYWTATYDFVAHDQRASAKALGAVNLAVAGAHWLAHRVAGDRHEAAELRALLPVHLAAAAGRLNRARLAPGP